MNQRWRNRLSSTRPAGEPIDTSRFDIAEIADDNTARDFVEAHHYSGSYPAARRRYGLYRGDELQGVAVFSIPCNNRVLAVIPGPALESVELGRFVLLDCVPGNGETWFLSRCFELLRADGFRGVVSFSDPVPRTTLDGCQVFPGHFGTIYQASNARYVGRGKARTLRILPNGLVFSDRAAQKVRSRSQGWKYSAKRLMDFGADEAWPDSAAWLNHWLGKLTRKLRHPGNFKYAFGLDRRVRRQLPVSLPYPKQWQFNAKGGA